MCELFLSSSEKICRSALIEHAGKRAFPHMRITRSANAPDQTREWRVEYVVCVDVYIASDVQHIFSLSNAVWADAEKSALFAVRAACFEALCCT